MVTNQIMTVQIGHLTQMGNLNDVLKIGNVYRKEKGLREIEIREWLVKESTWEFIIEVERKYGTFFQNLDSRVCISDYKNSSGQLDYSELMKKFSVIKSQRGGKPENRGYWANLQIMLDLAIYLSPTLRLEMIDIFINHKLLHFRDLGGDNFKELNILIDTIPDRIGKNNEYYYIAISIKIREKLYIISTRGYNQQKHDAIVQQKRTEYLSNLSLMIRVGFIKTASQLLEIIEKL
jgi:hypothetical protein